ncbi:hypothetical protein [Asticcacaulis solisilvae]|uniref:hypothetical protein n=1 Tax=Asticcacaulis solisilvae TaxID=1217274 RepID=UPI003FD88AC0
MAIVFKLILMIAGGLLVALGVVISPLPGPLGLPVVIVGLVLLLRSSTWVKRQFVKLYHKHPKWLGPLRSLMRPRAKFLAILWRFMLRAEGLALKPRNSLLRRIHRLFRRRHHAAAQPA